MSYTRSEVASALWLKCLVPITPGHKTDVVNVLTILPELDWQGTYQQAIRMLIHRPELMPQSRYHMRVERGVPLGVAVGDAVRYIAGKGHVYEALRTLVDDPQSLAGDMGASWIVVEPHRNSDNHVYFTEEPMPFSDLLNLYMGYEVNGQQGWSRVHLDELMEFNEGFHAFNWQPDRDEVDERWQWFKDDEAIRRGENPYEPKELPLDVQADIAIGLNQVILVDSGEFLPSEIESWRLPYIYKPWQHGWHYDFINTESTKSPEEAEQEYADFIVATEGKYALPQVIQGTVFSTRKPKRKDYATDAEYRYMLQFYRPDPKWTNLGPSVLVTKAMQSKVKEEKAEKRALKKVLKERAAQEKEQRLIDAYGPHYQPAPAEPPKKAVIPTWEPTEWQRWHGADMIAPNDRVISERVKWVMAGKPKQTMHNKIELPAWVKGKHLSGQSMMSEWRQPRPTAAVL